MVGLEKVESPEDVQALQGFISEHYRHTNSSVAKEMLDDYGTTVTKFVKVREKTTLLFFFWRDSDYSTRTALDMNPLRCA